MKREAQANQREGKARKRKKGKRRGSKVGKREERRKEEARR